jgi:hypothetical protein
MNNAKLTRRPRLRLPVIVGSEANRPRRPNLRAQSGAITLDSG